MSEHPVEWLGQDEQKTDHVEAFMAFAEESGISLDHRDDWFPWWECWCAGVTAERMRAQGLES